MPKSAAIATIATLVAVFAFALAYSQTVTNPSPAAAACAYNSSPPAVPSGQFVFVQCNSTGQLEIAP